MKRPSRWRTLTLLTAVSTLAGTLLQGLATATPPCRLAALRGLRRDDLDGLR